MTTSESPSAYVRVIEPGCTEWPCVLDALPDAPRQLWVRGPGNLAALTARALTLTGSRAASAYGIHVAAQLAADLAAAGVCVLAGGGYGIEAAAHRAALTTAAGDPGVTVVVSAAGVDRPYPAAHADLFDRIAATGAVVSPYPPGSTPDRARFLARDRILAALSSAVVVVEAARRSGALHLAECARELGRPVLAVPGPVTSATSTGCHDLLRAGHARLALSAADVLDAAPVARPPAGTTRPHG